MLLFDVVVERSLKKHNLATLFGLIWMRGQRVFFMLCFYPGLSCHWELTSHMSRFSLGGLLTRWDFPPHFRCLFVWSLPSLSVPIRQNTGGEKQNSNHFGQHVAGLLPWTSRVEPELYALREMPARYIIESQYFLSLRTSVGVCARAFIGPGMASVGSRLHLSMCVHGDVGAQCES